MSTSKSLSMLALGLMLAASGCAATTAVPQPFPVPGGMKTRPEPIEATPARAPSSATDGYSIAGTALALRGIPYRNGGSDPSGFDCSGFVWYVLAQHGIRISRTVSTQFHEGIDVSRDPLEAGDLVFFTTEAPGASHVGMVIGGDEFVHAPSTRGDVRVERLSSHYWASRYVGARRVR